MKLDLLTITRVVDDAIRFVSDNQKRVALSRLGIFNTRYIIR
jgi:hypothetical protein